MGYRLRPGAVPLIVAGLLLWQGGLHSAWGQPAGAQAGKSAAPICDRAAIRVIVDVGHTAESPGATSARGVGEYEFNLNLAKLIEQSLIDAGFAKTVLLVTEGPSRKGLFHRVEQANAASADLFLSIHHDSVPDRFLKTWEYEGEEREFSDRFKGHSIFISNENLDPTASLAFARLLGKALKARDLIYTPHYKEKFMGSRQRILVDAEVGVYRYDQLIVLRKTQMPAVLLEAGSIINRDEELLMASPERQALISAAVTEAVDRYCATRRPQVPEQVAHRPAAATKQPLQPVAAKSPANGAKQKQGAVAPAR
jgi:N-acetylmuramoyl-L-alanine amidase